MSNRKMVRFENKGLNHMHGSRKKTHGTVGVHPYLRAEFWNNPLNQFWNTDMYSDESKEYFNKWLNKMNEANLKIRGTL